MKILIHVKNYLSNAVEDIEVDEDEEFCVLKELVSQVFPIPPFAQRFQYEKRPLSETPFFPITKHEITDLEYGSGENFVDVLFLNQPRTFLKLKFSEEKSPKFHSNEAKEYFRAFFEDFVISKIFPELEIEDIQNTYDKFSIGLFSGHGQIAECFKKFDSKTVGGKISKKSRLGKITKDDYVFHFSRPLDYIYPRKDLVALLITFFRKTTVSDMGIENNGELLVIDGYERFRIPIFNSDSLALGKPGGITVRCEKCNSPISFSENCKKKYTLPRNMFFEIDDLGTDRITFKDYYRHKYYDFHYDKGVIDCENCMSNKKSTDFNTNKLNIEADFLLKRGFYRICGFFSNSNSILKRSISSDWKYLMYDASSFNLKNFGVPFDIKTICSDYGVESYDRFQINTFPPLRNVGSMKNFSPDNSHCVFCHYILWNKSKKRTDSRKLVKYYENCHHVYHKNCLEKWGYQEFCLKCNSRKRVFVMKEPSDELEKERVEYFSTKMEKLGSETFKIDMKCNIQLCSFKTLLVL